MLFGQAACTKTAAGAWSCMGHRCDLMRKSKCSGLQYLAHVLVEQLAESVYGLHGHLVLVHSLMRSQDETECHTSQQDIKAPPCKVPH